MNYMHLQANNLAASSRHIISSYRVEWLLLIKIKIFNISDICMDNKDRNQLGMEKKRSNTRQFTVQSAYYLKRGNFLPIAGNWKSW
jgi:hypothetical protein